MGRNVWKDKQGWGGTILEVLACHQRKRSLSFTLGLKTPGVYSIDCKCGWVYTGQTGLSVESHPPWTTRKVTVAGYNMTGNIITNSELRNPLHQILLHEMYCKGSNWTASWRLENGWWPCFQQVMETFIHPMNQWRKASC